MARGHQKFQSQQKNAQKQEKLKKAQGHDQKSAAQKALVFTCTVCKVLYDVLHCTNNLLTISFTVGRCTSSVGQTIILFLFLFCHTQTTLQRIN